MTLALFLDRDGVINKDHGYTHVWSDEILIPGIIDLILKFKQKMFKVIVITNQSGIGRGYYTDSVFHKFMTEMQTLLSKYDAEISDYYYCSCDPSKSICLNRKPEPTLFLKAAAENNINLQKSIMVGDKGSDLLAAHRAGIRGLYLFDRFDKGLSDVELGFQYKTINNLSLVKH
jgi:D-glycero-D-manno-heptose 1,7-bisphosphate phosphatase